MSWQPNHPAFGIIHNALAAAHRGSDPDSFDPQKIIEACADSPFFRQARVGTHNGRRVLFYRPLPPPNYNRPPLRDDRGAYPVLVAIGRYIELVGGRVTLHLPKNARLKLDKDPDTPHADLMYQIQVVVPGIRKKRLPGIRTQLPHILWDDGEYRAVHEVKGGDNYRLLIPENYELHISSAQARLFAIVAERCGQNIADDLRTLFDRADHWYGSLQVRHTAAA